MQAYDGSVQARGREMASSGPTTLEMLEAHVRHMNDKIAKMAAELATYNDRLMGNQGITPSAGPTPVAESVPVPYAGVVGAMGEGLNTLNRGIGTLQEEIRRLTRL